MWSVLIAVLLSTVAAAQDNLVPNPGFEYGDGDVPAHWPDADPGEHGNIESSTEAHAGKRSLAQSVDDTGKAQVWWSCDPFPVQPSETYTLSLWYRRTNAEGGLP